jgi:hypothetical protein
MREIRQSGSEGGEAGNSTGLPYPYQPELERNLAKNCRIVELSRAAGGGLALCPRL